MEHFSNVQGNSTQNIPPHPQLGFEYLKKFDTSLITFNILKDIIKIVAFMCKFLIITHKTVMG